MAIACPGYRVVCADHHRISFDVVKLATGKAADPRCGGRAVGYKKSAIAESVPMMRKSGVLLVGPTLISSVGSPRPKSTGYEVGEPAC
jgi:hypothetical protein